MAIIVSGESSFELHPEGQFRAVCVDVVEKRDVPTAWGPKTKVRLAWQTEEVRADGKPFLASSSFNASLAESSRLRPFLEAWRGKKFTPDELKAFDLENLIGVQAVIQVTHTQRDGKTYDNVTAIMRPMRGLEPVEPRDYVRVVDRPDASPAPAAPPARRTASAPAASDWGDIPEPVQEDDDDLPF
jgi:hypothetical protein